MEIQIGMYRSLLSRVTVGTRIFITTAEIVGQMHSRLITAIDYIVASGKLIDITHQEILTDDTHVRINEKQPIEARHAAEDIANHRPARVLRPYHVRAVIKRIDTPIALHDFRASGPIVTNEYLKMHVEP